MYQSEDSVLCCFFHSKVYDKSSKKNSVFESTKSLLLHWEADCCAWMWLCSVDCLFSHWKWPKEIFCFWMRCDCYAWVCSLDWPSDHFGDQVSHSDKTFILFQKTHLLTIGLKMPYKTKTIAKIPKLNKIQIIQKSQELQEF